MKTWYDQHDLPFSIFAMPRRSVILIILLIFFRFVTPSTSSTEKGLEASPATTTETVKRKYNHYKYPETKPMPHWSYKDTDAWISKYPTCGGEQQSPIDIHPNSTVRTTYPNFKFHNYGFVDGMELINNGHSAAYNLPAYYPKKKTPHITGGGLRGIYQFAQIHFHWGSDSTKGSEHLINSKSHSAELHMVHWNIKYGSYAEASKYSHDGLAVLTVFVKVVPEDNKYFHPLVQQLGEIINNGDETIVKQPISLYDLLPRRMTSFYRYFGSLTTPGCHELVIWTIFDRPIDISEKQLNKFRQLKDEIGDPIVDNFRPPQPLNYRTVYYRSFSVPEIPLAAPYSVNIYAPLSEAYKWSKATIKSYATRILGIFDQPHPHRPNICQSRPC